MQDETKSMNEYESYESEQEQLLTLMEQIQTQNEKLKAQQTEQSAKIQKLLSDKRELELTVQQQGKKIAEQVEQIEKLNESDKQLSEANRKLKEAEQKLKNAEKLKKTAEETGIAYSRASAEVERMKNTTIATIEKNVALQVKQETRKIREQAYEVFNRKLSRIKNFAVSAISILGIYCMCVTGAWISDHTAVFVGQTGISSFFISLWDMMIKLFTGCGDLLKSFVGSLTGLVGNLFANLIVYGLFTALCIVGLILGVCKGIPKIKKFFNTIKQTYARNGVVGYKKSMTVSICIIALCFAVLLAEYATLNVITAWLVLSLVGNIAYHFFTYDSQGF